jgi:hypothetical protein
LEENRQWYLARIPEEPESARSTKNNGEISTGTASSTGTKAIAASGSGTPSKMTKPQNSIEEIESPSGGSVFLAGGDLEDSLTMASKTN